MPKTFTFIILLLAMGCLFAQSGDLAGLLDSLLVKNTDYQQAVSRYQQEKALSTIDQSLSWFDVNLHYQQYDNDFTRDETETTLEHSTVTEKDKRWGVELSKQLFPKDADDISAAIGNRLSVLRYRQEAKLAYSSAIGDIFDDFITWYKADRMVASLQARLDVLYQQNNVLEDLLSQNDVAPETLIDNLEEIDDKEDELAQYKEAAALYQSKYGDILPVFLSKLSTYASENPQPDSLQFINRIDNETQELNKETAKIQRRIKFGYTHFFLPELNFSLSYNWRENRQVWDIEKNSIFKTMIRNQDEEFPEGKVELSLPFNLWFNTGGKLALLKSYNRELNYRSKEMQLAWQEFAIKRMNGYRAASLELKRKNRLYELYAAQLDLQTRKFREEPSLLGSNPTQKLQKETARAGEALTDLQVAEMKFYREVFLINHLRERI